MSKLFKIILCYTLFAALGHTSLAQNFQIQRPYFEKEGEKLQLPALGGLNSPQFGNIDLDLDGRLDILILEKNSGKIVPIIREGSRHKTDYSFLNILPPIQDWFVCKDYNGDGLIDIFTSTPGGIQLYKNTSSTSLSFELEIDLVNSLRIYQSQSFSANIFVTFSDIPLIDDLDNDGDLDILTFALGGNTIEHHKNLSIEKTGIAGMDFQLVNSCYAYVTDDFSGSAFELGIADCPDNVINPEKRVKHSGFTFNLKQGNPKSLLVGELNSDKMVELFIGQSQFGGDSATQQAKSFPTQAPDNLLFLASYRGLFDLDDEEDIIIASNIRGSSTQNSVWLYNENEILKKNNFLQEQTIDEGEHAQISTLDWDGDGDQDLIIASAVREDFLLPKISFWENIGTTSDPKFKFIKEHRGDFSLAPPLSVSIHSFGTNNTLLFGNSEGLIWESSFSDVFQNGFSATQLILKDESNIPISGSSGAHPIKTVFNGAEVLLIGNNKGRIKHFAESGSGYILVTNQFLGIDVKGGAFTQQIHLSVANDSLWVFTQDSKAIVYSLFESNPTGNLKLDYSSIVGVRSTGHIKDINNDNLAEILIGTDDGGLIVYSASSITSIQEKREAKNLLYPNPTYGVLHIQGLNDKSSYKIYNSPGEMILNGETNGIINVSSLNKGLYILQLSNSVTVENHKFWKQ